MKLVRINRGQIRAAIILFAGSVICVMVSALIFTNIGAHTLFKLGVIFNSEAVDTSDTVYLEYYDVKRYINETSGFRVFIGGNSESGSAESDKIRIGYMLALDFLKFAKQNTVVTTVRFDSGDAEILNAYLESGDTTLLGESGLSAVVIGFMTELYGYNEKLPPQKRVSIACGGECRENEFMPTEKVYDRSLAKNGIIDVSCIYSGTENCEPFFKISVRDIHFGSFSRLEWFTNRLSAVSGNFGQPEFTGHNQPEFYYLISETTADLN